jgi:uncharacterized membrane protein YeiB
MARGVGVFQPFHMDHIQHPGGKRIVLLDVFRGFAIFGIFVVTIIITKDFVLLNIEW